MAKTSGPTGPVDYPPPPELAPLIGELVMAFSYSETAVQLLIWRILGLSFLDGRALTGRLDAKPKLRLLEQLCERHMKSTVQASRVAAAVKALEAAVDYRNMAAHGDWRTKKAGQLYCFSIQYDTGEDPAESGRYGVKPCDLVELAGAAQDCRVATVELWAIDKWLKVTPRGSW